MIVKEERMDSEGNSKATKTIISHLTSFRQWQFEVEEMLIQAE
jgi:hypothetical protein